MTVNSISDLALELERRYHDLTAGLALLEELPKRYGTNPATWPADAREKFATQFDFLCDILREVLATLRQFVPSV